MELTKGQKGRRVCGTIQAISGVLCATTAISQAWMGHIDVMSFLFAAFMIMTGILGASGPTKERIIAYLVCGIICSLLFIFATIFITLGFVVYKEAKRNYFELEDLQPTPDPEPLLTEVIHSDPYDNGVFALLIVNVVIFASASIVAVIGVICAILPWCGK